MLNPVWGTILNFLVGGLGLAETSGLTNVLGTQGGKAGAIAVMILGFLNGGLHGISSAQAGPFVSAPSQPQGPNPGMRTMGIFLLAALFLWPVTGRATDLNKPVKAPEIYLDPWNGFYVGAHGGWGINAGREVFQTPDIGVEAGAKSQGFLAGIHAGYGQRVAGSYYLGMEADGDYNGMSGDAGLSVVQTTDKMHWLASSRARAGYIYDRIMLYGTAGWGWGGTTKSFQIIETGNSASAAKTQNGFVWGLGAEYAFTSQWLARVEYRQYLFGKAGAGMQDAVYTVHDNINTFTGGLTYKF